MDFLIYGGGGHGKSVADGLLQSGHQVLAIFDKETGKNVLPGLPKTQPYDHQLHPAIPLIICIGNNAVRAHLSQTVGHALAGMVHPKAVVSPHAQLGRAVTVMAGATVGPDAVIDNFAIINTGAVADHDCRVGAYSHLGPGAVLTGGVVLKQQVFVGAGATVLPNTTIEFGATVGAGATVTKNVAAGLTVVGVPARPLK